MIPFSKILNWLKDELNRQYALFALLAFLLPFHRVASSIPMILCFAHWMYLMLKRGVPLFIREGRLLLFLCGFYLLHVVGVFYSQDMGEAGYELQSKLSLLLLPLVFMTLGRADARQRWLVPAAFRFGLYVFVSIALLTAIWQGDAGSFFYIKLVSFTNIHPTYLSMFMIFGLILEARESYFERDHRWIGLRLLGMGVLSLFVLMLSSRAGMISLFVTLNFSAFVLGKRYFGAWMGLFAVLVINLMVYVSIQQFDVTRIRFNAAKASLLKGKDVEHAQSVNQRQKIYKLSMQTLLEELPFGVGTGDVPHELGNRYREAGFDKGANRDFNAHNQFLQTGIALGLFGLVYLLMYFMYPIWLSISRRQWIYTGLLLLFAFNCGLESMLQSQSGIVFFAFFNAWYLLLEEK